MSSPFRRALSLGVLPVVLLAPTVLAACGGDDDHHDSTGSTVAVSADAIVIDIDADAAQPGAETVAKGSTVSLQITSAEEHEFHLHGYDLENSGTEVTITFVADEAGEFVVENHDTEATIFTLTVE